MHRFFVTADSIAGPTVELTPQQAHQVRNVLRLAPPDRIIVLDNTGFEYEAELTTLHQEKLHARILHKRLVNTEPDTQLSLMPSLLPREKFEHILQKCTEVGVARFLPIVTRRSLIKDPKIKTAKLTRWRKIITEAAEQSHRGRIPHLAAPVTFADATRHFGDFDTVLLAWPRAENHDLRNILPPANPAKIALLIGPEGDFTDDEVTAARQKGAVPFSLGPRILRTETAAIVASALIIYQRRQTP